MSFKKTSRRSFFSNVAGIGISLLLISKWGISGMKTSRKLNRPLIVTSKTNPFVKEKITTTSWEILQKGETPIDAAEKAVNISELDCNYLHRKGQRKLWQ